MRVLNALFELAVSLTAFVFFACNAGQLFKPGTHPQWRFFIAVSFLVGAAALAFFVNSARRIKEDAPKDDAKPPNKG